MNERKRLNIMIGLVVLLGLANVISRMGSGDGDSTFWSGVDDLSESYSPRLVKKMQDIEELPALSFISASEDETVAEVTRNPFVFGVDRRKEEEQRQRMEEIKAARQEELANRALQEPAPVVPVVEEVRFDGKIIGLLQDMSNGTVKLSVMIEDEVHVISKNETLLERYQLIDIKEDQAHFLNLADKKELKVPLNLD